MSDFVDLQPAADRLSALVRGVQEADLARETPCDIPVSRLVAHIDGLALAFRVAAEDPGAPLLSMSPEVGRDVLEPGWEQRIPERLDRLSGVWQTAEQDGSMTRVGGVDLPRAVAVRVALQELVLHGWDLAMATGQPYDVDAESLAIVHHMVSTRAEPDTPPDGLFGPVVVVPDDASALDRTVGLAGRSPAWPN